MDGLSRNNADPALQGFEKFVDVDLRPGSMFLSWARMTGWQGIASV
jgi:hypothetical protein